MRTTRARGNMLTIAAAIIAAAGALWAGVAAFGPGPGDRLASAGGGGGAGGASTTSKVAKKRRAPTTAELRGALARLNLTPPLLAAAGLSGQETTVLVSNARQYLTDNPEELSSADNTYHNAQAEYDRLERLIQQGQSTPNDRASFSTAQSNLSSAGTSRDSATAALRIATLAGVSQAKQDALATMRANLKWRLPLQYLVTSRPDADWVTLRDALTNDAQAVAAQVDPDPAMHQALVDANAVPATITAGQNLVNNQADVRTAYAAAIQGG
jgi:hypothetical protein